MDDIFEESPIILLAKPCFLKDIGSNQHQETIQENHFHKLNRDIEENIFSLLCKLHEIALASSQLEQYVLRELRHLQVTHVDISLCYLISFSSSSISLFFFLLPLLIYYLYILKGMLGP